MTRTIEEKQNMLRSFKSLLLEEKEALINNQGEKVQKIVKEKEDFAECFAELTLSDDERTMLLPNLEEIRTLQETNLILTQQSLEFVSTFIESIQKEAKKQSVTYSKKGAYTEAGKTAFLDQSL